MTDHTITRKAGEFHVWTKSGNWIAWFRTEELAKELIAYEKRVRELESEGMTRSDAQAVADAEQGETK